MLRYLLGRLILAGATLLVILLVTYVLLRLAPGDPTKSEMLSSDGSAQVINADQNSFGGNKALRESLMLDKPILTGFGFWLWQVVCHGELGVSCVVEPGRPVTEVIGERLPLTLRLNIIAVILTYLLAIPIGVYAATRAGGVFDNTSAIMVFILYSLPGIWVALVLQALFSYGGWLGILPLRGITVAGAETLSSWQLFWAEAKCYILPVICLTYAGFAGLSRYARAGMLEVLHQDYIRTARAKGLEEQVVIWHHGFRNALITLITLFAGLLPGLIAGSIFIEYVYNLPGMGQLSLQALSSRDYPLQMAICAFAGALTLLGILLSDILYTIADPRIKLK